jgi:hypothetical protein
MIEVKVEEDKREVSVKKWKLVIAKSSYNFIGGTSVNVIRNVELL